MPRATDTSRRSSDHPEVVGFRRQLKTIDAAVAEAKRFLDHQIDQARATLRGLLDDEDPVDDTDPEDDSRPFRAFSSSSIASAAKLPPVSS